MQIIRKAYDCANNKRNPRIQRVTYKFLKLFINLVVPILFYGISGSRIDPNGEVVVSLTSFPQRINTVYLTIVTLFFQTVKPREVILYLSREQFPKEEDMIPKKLRKLQEHGLSIEFVSDDIGPHKKYFYAMKRYPDLKVLTVDDDMFYPEDMLEKMLKTAKQYPKTIVCNWSHVISFDNGEKPKPYNTWSDKALRNPAYELLPVGCGGVLYPSKSLDIEVFNLEVIKTEVLNTDDLWLKIMSLMNSIKSYNSGKDSLIYFDCIRSSVNGLWIVNSLGNFDSEVQNDVIFRKLLELYPKAKERLVNII